MAPSLNGSVIAQLTTHPPNARRAVVTSLSYCAKAVATSHRLPNPLDYTIRRPQNIALVEGNADVDPNSGAHEPPSELLGTRMPVVGYRAPTPELQTPGLLVTSTPDFTYSHYASNMECSRI
ncbi:hypothetical protein SARC_02519 [Sphaeroforma arctica JP610]|uniref:Uncharacterized protein n=1 Tax=Sphaeroforma arctica JP610 TaxID=667725 RepID=A0A0L0G8T9_9EUKA|nr:hypothetical protein SARC_02519 [Sphaeroforma arctica JP610]KNC85296.1 hypothetical protein SARC_02519 [Sphaeroforma arctica JP610]|eukprot:XP_014159198.1 hypothetical protein SARC_02519 [Sphaeroforma arctica JP610]